MVHALVRSSALQEKKNIIETKKIKTMVKNISRILFSSFWTIICIYTVYDIIYIYNMIIIYKIDYICQL